MMSSLNNILNLSYDDLLQWCKENGEVAYRAQQIYQWLYQKQATSFDEMSNLSKKFRSFLQESFCFDVPKVEKKFLSEDGSIKLLVSCGDGKTVETVILPMRYPEGPLEGQIRNITLCISSQVGCAIACTFCNTATQGLMRNLSTAEIVGQVIAAKRVLRDSLMKDIPMSNIVYMGMGEPFHNFDAVVKSFEVFLDERGLNFSKRKITVSTSGLIPEIEKFSKLPVNLRVNLAVSLNAPTDQLREQVMPINRAYPLDRLMTALRNVPLDSHRRITMEYILMRDFNDSEDCIPQLQNILRGIPVKLNLIPYNEFPGSPYKRPTEKGVLKFQKALLDRGMHATVRYSKGRDVMAACGMLKSASS